MLFFSTRAATALTTRLAIAWLILLALVPVSNAQNQGAKPNILFILTDDLGVNDIGAWGDGKATTPTLDQLSQQSLRFRQHYTDSTCSVSRAALITGRAPVSIGFEPNGLGLSPDLQTLPESLKGLGYSTHHIGKWHVGEAIEYPQIRPNHHGFDDWFGMLNHFVLHGPDKNGKLVNSPPTFINPWLETNDGPPVQYQGHLDDLLTDRAIDLIIQGRQGGKPWFINLWLFSPHHPFQPSEAFRSQFPDTDEGRYLAVLKQLDHNVSRLLDSLRASGQLNNTLVVFTSDNGSPNLARDSNFPLTGTKMTYLEGGVRTPLLVLWPGHRGNADVTGISHITDLYPTVVGMAGGKAPAGLTGRDLSSYIAKGQPLPRVDALYWAADVMTWGMTYGGHLPGRGLFYRPTLGKLESHPVTGPLGVSAPKAEAFEPIERDEAVSLLRAWERKYRPVPLTWHPASGKKPAFLSGRDYQRAPTHGAYSFGLGLGKARVEGARQVLVEQDGLWGMAIDKGRLEVWRGPLRVQSEPVALDRQCNTLVASFNVKPYSKFPFPGPEKGALTVYLNGKVILQSQEPMPRPETAEPLAHPTYIGASATGADRFAGKIARPLLVGKFMLPQLDGYNLDDMQATLCPSNSAAR